MEDGHVTGSQRAARRRAPRYDGEDLSPTTTRELRGFYAYSLAAEVFAVCGVGSFLPVTLEQLARERGVLWADRTVPCVVKKAAEQSTAAVVKLLSRAAETDNNQCIVNVLGAEMTTSSFVMYTSSIAVFIQALALVSFSSIADHGSYRKQFLVGFGFTGAISSMLFIAIVPRVFIIGAFLCVVGVTCLGSSFVILNSFIPVLVANHPLVNDGGQQDVSRQSSIPLESFSPGLRRRESADRDQQRMIAHVHGANIPDSSELKLSTKISARGVGIGYVAAVFVQILSILLLYTISKTSVSSTLPLRLVLFIVGLWWFAFTIPSFLWLRHRPGPPLRAISGGGNLRSFLTYTSFAWGSLWTTIKVAAKLRQVVIFLIAWFLLSDAIATIGSTAIMFARTELRMGTVAIALLSITATSSGVAGAFTWPVLSRRYALKTNRTIVACIVMMEIVPIYGLMGYIPFVKAWGVGGLQKSWEIYPLGFVHGFVMGGISSYCRSFFGRLIPPGSETAFYALMAITDKGSSTVGPTIVGLIVDAAGTIRPAFLFLAILVALPAPLMWMVNADKGQEDAVRMAGLLKKIGADEDELDDRADAGFQEAEGLMRDHD